MNLFTCCKPDQGPKIGLTEQAQLKPGAKEMSGNNSPDSSYCDLLKHFGMLCCVERPQCGAISLGSLILGAGFVGMIVVTEVTCGSAALFTAVDATLITGASLTGAGIAGQAGISTYGVCTSQNDGICYQPKLC